MIYYVKGWRKFSLKSVKNLFVQFFSFWSKQIFLPSLRPKLWPPSWKNGGGNGSIPSQPDFLTFKKKSFNPLQKASLITHITSLKYNKIWKNINYIIIILQNNKSNQIKFLLFKIKQIIYAISFRFCELCV